MPTAHLHALQRAGLWRQGPLLVAVAALACSQLFERADATRTLHAVKPCCAPRWACSAAFYPSSAQCCTKASTRPTDPAASERGAPASGLCPTWQDREACQCPGMLQSCDNGILTRLEPAAEASSRIARRRRNMMLLFDVRIAMYACRYRPSGSRRPTTVMDQQRLVHERGRDATQASSNRREAPT